MRRFLLLWLATLLPGATTPGAAQQGLAGAIDSIAAAALRDGPIPGLSVAVVRGTDTVVMRGYGFADLEHDVPAGPQTVYRIGSITKQFTAAAILRLVEQGKISLHDPVSKYLPGLPAWSERATIHHLLNHTSGIRSYTGLGRKWLDRMRLDLSHDEMLALFKDEPVDFAPGERWLYNNSGYYLLGMILEEVTGEPYAEHLRKTLFEPLGLEQTTYCSERPLIEHRAAGYSVADGEFMNAEPLSMRQPFSAGALCSTVRDLVRWTRALEEGRVVAPGSYRAMLTPTRLADGKDHPYGYGLGLGELEGHRRISHGGGINGFITALAHYPEDDVVIAVLTNSGQANPGRIERRIAQRVLGIPVPEVKDLPLSAAERARYVGEYEVQGERLRVLEADGGLRLEGPRSARLLYQGDHVFASAADPELRLQFQLKGWRAGSVTVHLEGTRVGGARVPEPPRR